MAVAEDLNLDVLFFHIFPKLPVKSLIRFRNVCRRWRILLMKPELVRMHLRHVTADNTYKYLRMIKIPRYEEDFHAIPGVALRPIPMDDVVGMHSLGSSVHGMLLIGTFESVDRHLVLLNPLTGEYKKLSSKVVREDKKLIIIKPFTDYDTYYFYHDSNIDDYKVVHTRRQYDPSIRRGYVYSLKSDSWKEVKDVVSFDLLTSYSRNLGVLFCGTIICWLMLHNRIRDQLFILGFNMETEKFMTNFPSLPNFSSQNMFPKLIVIQGSLCLVNVTLINPLEEFGTINVWRMDETVWTKILSISTDENYIFFYKHWARYKLWALEREPMFQFVRKPNEKVIMSISCFQDQGRVFIPSQSLSLSMPDNPNGIGTNFLKIHYFTNAALFLHRETLVSPNNVFA